MGNAAFYNHVVCKETMQTPTILYWMPHDAELVFNNSHGYKRQNVFVIRQTQESYTHNTTQKLENLLVLKMFILFVLISLHNFANQPL